MIVAKDLKKWDVFVNSNNYDCIVYKRTDEEIFVFNTNGTNYRLNKDSPYQYEKSEKDATNFFASFPVKILDFYKDYDFFRSLRDQYFAKSNKPTERNLLLLLTI